MYLKRSLLFFFVLNISLALAQPKDRYQILKSKKLLCEKITNNLSGKPESIDSLILVGNEGLKACIASDHEYLFAFNQTIGIGYYYKQDFKNAKNNFEIAYSEAVKSGLVEKSLKPLGNLISVYYYLGLQNKADDAAQKLKKIAENTDTLKYKTDVYYNLGLYNQQQKFYYSIALENFIKSAELHKPIADTTKILKRKIDYGVKLMMIAEIYLYLKQPNKALQYLNEVKPYLNKSVIFNITAYGKFIRCYALLNNSTEAEKYYDLLQESAGDNPGNWSQLVSSNIELANLALKQENFKLAKAFADRANEQAKKGNNEILTSSANLLYGDYYKKIKNNLEAAKYYKLAEHGAMVYNKEEYVDLLKSLTYTEIKIGNLNNAEQYFNKYVSLSDSLNERKISLNLAEMEARFQNDYKQQQIGSLNKDNLDKNLQLKQEKTTRWLLIATAILLFIVVLSIYYNFRNKQKANQMLDQKNQELDAINERLNESNQTKTKLFSIISHDLRSPVSQLFSFLKIQQTNAEVMGVEERKIHQESLLKSSRNLLETMEDLLLWSKSQMEHFEIDTKQVDIEALFSTSIELLNAQAEAKNIQFTIRNIAFLTVDSDFNILQAILRNLLQNAVNSAYANTEIMLSGNLTPDGHKFISIVNYSAVISEETINKLMHNVNLNSQSSGYGLLIVKELAEKIHAKINITSTEKEGTEVRVLFNS